MPTHELSAPQQQADNSSNIYNDQKELKASKKVAKGTNTVGAMEIPDESCSAGKN